MSEIKHTPGPWAVWADDEVFSVTTKKVVVPDSDLARNKYDDDMVCRSESKANARLIAAAPELLEFAEEWLRIQGSDENYMTAKAKKAIAKATGASQ